MFTTSDNAARFFTVSGTSNGASARTAISVSNDVGAELTIDAYGSGNSGTILGLPAANLHKIRSSSASSGLVIQTGGSGDPLVFGTAELERVRIDGSGNVGIGTTTPASLLHVSAGVNATTTVEFGAQSVTSKTCFNVRDALGAATSFYFVGTTMIVEANRCR